MKVKEFNKMFSKLEQKGGREYFEEYVQYCGWWFLQLTENQCDKVADLLLTWGYDTKTNHIGKMVLCPNGLGLYFERF